MVVSDFESIESGLAITRPDIEDDAYLLRESDWLVLFPEVNQNYGPVGISPDVPSRVDSSSGFSTSSSSFSVSLASSDDQIEIAGKDAIKSRLAVGPLDQSDLKNDEQDDINPPVAKGLDEVSPVGVQRNVPSKSESCSDSSSSSSFSECSASSGDQSEIEEEDDITSRLAVGSLDHSDLKKDEQAGNTPPVAKGLDKVASVGVPRDVPSRSDSSSDSFSTSSSFSESSESSDDQIETEEEDDITSAVGYPDQSDFKDDEQVDNTPSMAKGPDEVSQHQTSGSQASSPTHGLMVQHTSPMHSPEVQVMERDSDYDPDRIPLSTFSRCDSLTPVDWSAGSTESLFSIPVGNTSFRSPSIRKSGEMSKRGKLPLLSPSSSSSHPTVTRSGEKDVFGVKTSTGSTEAVNKTKKDMGKTYPVDQEQVEVPLPVAATLPVEAPVCCQSLSRQSQPDGSEGSSMSPLRCKRGSCSWSFCSRWNCSLSLKRLFSTEPPLSPTTQIDSAKSNSYQLPTEATYPMMTDGTSHTKSSACCHCFSCFSCQSYFSCGSCCSYQPCSSCGSCKSCSSCFSCKSCGSCFSCKPCGSCCSLRSCNPCSSCCSLRSCNPCSSCCAFSFRRRCSSCWSFRYCRLWGSCCSPGTCTSCSSSRAYGSCGLCYPCSSYFSCC